MDLRLYIIFTFIVSETSQQLPDLDKIRQILAKANQPTVSDGSNNKPEVCTLDDNRTGVCVIKALCQNSQVADHGEGIIIKRFGKTCSNADLVCCRLPSNHPVLLQLTTPQSQPGIPQPVIPQPVVPQPGIPQPGIPQPVIPQPVVPQPGIPQPVIPQPVVPQPGLPQPVIPQPVISQPQVSSVTSVGCGWRDEEGVDGVPVAEGQARRGEFPWTVNIVGLVDIKIGSVSYIGTGSLIHHQVVLTAAHVLDNNDNTTLLTSIGDYTRDQKENGKQYIVVKSVVKHESYNTKNLVYDVALLFLTKKAVEGPMARFACLPDIMQAPFAGAECIVSGWSQNTFVMAKLAAPAIDRAECLRRMRSTLLGPLFILDDSFLCAGGQEGVDACVTGGGSPLVCPLLNEPSRYVQHGMVAWSMQCSNSPTAYVSVSYVRQWIDEKMRANSYGTDTYTVK